MRARRIVVSLLVTLLIFTAGKSVTQAQELGLAYFAISAPKFPCDQALQPFVQKKFSALATLWSTFGDNQSCLTRWFSAVSDRPHFLEIHLSNEACRRNKRCAEGELFGELSVAQYNAKLVAKDETLLEGIRKRIAEIRSYVESKKNANTELVLSTGLEDNFTPAAAAVMLETVRGAWPYKIVRSPVGDLKGREPLSADYYELHADKPKFPPQPKCIANLDGTDIIFPHRAATLKEKVSWEGLKRYVSTYGPQCRVTFFWSGLWQGITSERFEKPRDRTFVVSAEDLAALETINLDAAPAEMVIAVK